MSKANDHNELLVANTTAIIKAFERPRALRRLVKSLQRFYPTMRIIVADDSLREPTPPPGVEFIRLEPDTGASEGRNQLLQRVATPLFWQLDDDFELTKGTSFEKLATPVAQADADIVGGDCIRCKRKWFGWLRHKPSPFYGRIDFRDGELRLSPGEHRRDEGYLVCDIVPQFFVARTKTIVDMGGWDSELKTEEHEEFFVRCQQHGLRTLYCPDVTVRHWSDLPAHYAKFRQRSYRPSAAAKMGIQTWIDMDGRVTHFDLAAIAHEQDSRRTA